MQRDRWTERESMNYGERRRRRNNKRERERERERHKREKERDRKIIKLEDRGWERKNER